MEPTVGPNVTAVTISPPGSPIILCRFDAASPLDAEAIRAAVALYFLGLLAGCANWVYRSEAFRHGSRLEVAIADVLQGVKANKANYRPATQIEEVELLKNTTLLSLGGIFRVAKRPGNRALIWSYLSLALFFVATSVLVADFELRPYFEASPAAATASEPPRPNNAPIPPKVSSKHSS